MFAYNSISQFPHILRVFISSRSLHFPTDYRPIWLGWNTHLTTKNLPEPAHHLAPDVQYKSLITSHRSASNYIRSTGSRTRTRSEDTQIARNLEVFHRTSICSDLCIFNEILEFFRSEQGLINWFIVSEMIRDQRKLRYFIYLNLNWQQEEPSYYSLLEIETIFGVKLGLRSTIMTE